MLHFKKYDELKKHIHGVRLPYHLLLQTAEWDDKRNAIKARDGHVCLKCGKGETWVDTESHPVLKYYFWFGEEKECIVRGENGVLQIIELPEIIPADKPYWLEVHHCYYISNRLPWNYPDEALQTLCNHCHKEIHKQETILVYSEDMSSFEVLGDCTRCDGQGVIPEYSHVSGGICFACRGTGGAYPS